LTLSIKDRPLIKLRIDVGFTEISFRNIISFYFSLSQDVVKRRQIVKLQKQMKTNKISIETNHNKSLQNTNNDKSQSPIKTFIKTREVFNINPYHQKLMSFKNDNQNKKYFVVLATYAIIDKFAVMVEFVNTFIAL
jgi:hypothetical protein